MGASSSKGVWQLVVIGVTIEAVGSVLGLLLWKLITHVVKRCRQGPPQALPLLPLTAVGESAEQTLATANAQNLERRASNAADEAVAEAAHTTSSSPTNYTGDHLPLPPN